ncbi:hypothetical protein KI655_11750 [Vibrio sp. D404a]|uniref:hypothetical protein n=1 Tax=unclassified Vibrio TaxID=2614977 RepID=UPI00255686CE|nr:MULTISPECIES: hypothetical protein [unclassified Vibrio]MDK9737970.1 hypothetical protein [Vibrio sp. D404a]MDK9796261.1 hypothetical protein [Vibrio sp. D449a]
MFRNFLVFSLVTMLAGCVLYPTTRDYYKPVVKLGQVETASAGCGYHKAKYDGLEQRAGGITVRAYPHFSLEENTLSLTLSTESEYDNVEVTLNKVVSNDVELPSVPLTLSSDYVVSEVYRAWYTSDAVRVQGKPGKLLITASDNYGNTYTFEFEFASQKDIYYSSINC